MNKLQFHQGGQPVCLEDLQLLQDNMQKLILALFPLSHASEEPGSDDDAYPPTASDTVFATARHINHSPDTNSATLQAHLLITPDAIYDVPEFTLREGDAASAGYDGYNPLEAPLYYQLRQTDTDIRTFHDGTEHPVVTACTAQIVIGRPATGTSYLLSGIPSFDGQLETLLNIRRRVQRAYYAVELEA